MQKELSSNYLVPMVRSERAQLRTEMAKNATMIQAFCSRERETRK